MNNQSNPRIKTLTKTIHEIVRVLRLEEVFYALSRINPICRKFIPLPANYTGQNPIKIKRDNVFFIVDRSDYMQWHIYAGLPDIAWKIAKDYTKNGANILDIGSNVGSFTLKMAQACDPNTKAKFYAFEPNPIIAQRINANLELNPGLKDKVEIVECAISNEDGVSDFVFSETNTGGGKITSGGQYSLQVETQRLDTFVSENNLDQVDFIKIDVEGFEVEVFDGALGIIETIKPPLYFEVTESWYTQKNRSIKEVLDFLERLNYRFMLDINGKLTKTTLNEKFWQKYFQVNVLALP